jgi:hypothetical protein
MEFFFLFFTHYVQDHNYTACLTMYFNTVLQSFSINYQRYSHCNVSYIPLMHAAYPSTIFLLDFVMPITLNDNKHYEDSSRMRDFLNSSLNSEDLNAKFPLITLI